VSVRASSSDLLACRQAVRSALADLDADAGVIVACSGGPDSLALAGVVGQAAGRDGLRATAVIVDHGLQQDSAQVCDAARRACEALGLASTVVRVEVGRRGGPEGAAREARYAALQDAAIEQGAAAVLLGHTLEDQAETVLLRLARGSGARSLAAMAPVAGLWRRPFLQIPRARVRRAAHEVLEPLGLEPWQDPHNNDPAFARVRVRAVLEGLRAQLGDGVVAGLARSADLLRDDADALEALAARAYDAVVTVNDAGWSAECDELAALPAAVRTRVLRTMIIAAGCPADDAGLEHIRVADSLVTDWHGQGAAHLPSGVRVERACGRLSVHAGAGIAPSDRTSSHADWRIGGA